MSGGLINKPTGSGSTLAIPRRNAVAGDVIRTIGGMVSGGVTPNVGQEQCHPFVVPAGLKIVSLSVSVVTPVVGAVLRVGARADANGYPSALLVDAGTIDASASGLRTITGLNIVSAEPDGLVWLTSVAQGSPSAVYLACVSGGLAWVSDIMSSAGALTGWPSRNGITGALPADYSPRGTSSYQAPPALYATLAAA